MTGEEILVVMLVVMVTMLGGVLLYARHYKRVPPNRAMIVYGLRRPGSPIGFSVITAGGRYIMPIRETVAWMSLNVHTLELTFDDVGSDVRNHGPRLRMQLVAQARISGDGDRLLVAAQNLLGKPDEEIQRIARLAVESHIRAVCASLSAQEVGANRDAVAEQVRERAEKDLEKIGMELPSLVLREVSARREG